MTIVDWADVTLPLIALCWGAFLTWKYADAIDHWVQLLDKALPEWANR
jgi:hypothetical protein